MAQIIKQPTIIPAAGNKPKEIREFFGRITSNTETISIAHMKSPSGWTEPGQTPEFDEYTIVLKGTLHVKLTQESYFINEGEAIMVCAGEWVQYSSPKTGGAEYIAVCLPAFSPETVNRDE